MILQAGHRGSKIIIQPVNAVIFRILCHCSDNRLPLHFLPQSLADIRVIRYNFRHNIGSALKGIFHSFNTLFRVNIPLGQFSGVLPCLLKKLQCQRLKSLFLGSGCPGAAFLLIRPVQVLRFRQSLCRKYGSEQLLCELTLGFNGTDDFLLPLGKISQILQSGFQISQGGIIHTAVKLFPVAGNKGNGIAFIQKGHNIFDILFFLVEFKA